MDMVYQPLIYKEHYNLFVVERSQIVFFWYCFQDFHKKHFNLKEIKIIDNLTETEWYYFCNSYIGLKIHNKP